MKDQVGENRLSIIAAGVAFYMLLAFVPALAALVAIYGLFADPATIGDRVAALDVFLPEQALSLVAEQLERLAMTRLVDDLLDVSRISRGKVALHCEPISVQGAIHDAPDSIAGRVEERGQRVEVDLSKYTQQGGRIRVSVTEAPAEVAIAIADDGIGIEPVNPALLFEPFRQLDTSVDRSAGGLGIGLTLVRRQAELHGGSAVAASEGLGRGACFTVRRPRVAAAAH